MFGKFKKWNEDELVECIPVSLNVAYSKYFNVFCIKKYTYVLYVSTRIACLRLLYKNIYLFIFLGYEPRGNISVYFFEAVHIFKKKSSSRQNSSSETLSIASEVISRVLEHIPRQNLTACRYKEPCEHWCR